MKKIGWTILLFVLGMVAVGCEGQVQEAQARVRLKVFEIPTRILQRYASGGNLYRLPGSDYSLSIVSPADVDAMLNNRDATPRILAENNRLIDTWPRLADTWAYSRASGRMRAEAYCSGGGAGFLGVREREGELEIHVEYMVTHRGPRGEKLVESEIFYEYFYPQGRVLLFHTPTNGSEQEPRHHVVALQAAREDAVPVSGSPYSKGPQRQEVEFR